MTYFFVNGDVGIGFPGGGDVVVGKILGKAQQNAYGQFIIQEPAFQVAGGSAPGAGVKADIVTHLNAQFPGVFGRGNILVQHHFHGGVLPFGIAVGTVDMHRSVAQLEGAFNGFAGAGVDGDVFCFAIFCPHAADGGQLKPSVALNLADHAAQGVAVGFQQQTVVFCLAPKVCQHAALGGDFRCKAQLLEGFLYPNCSASGKAGRGVNGQQSGSLLPGIFCIVTINHIVLLIINSARRQPLPA